MTASPHDACQICQPARIRPSGLVVLMFLRSKFGSETCGESPGGIEARRVAVPDLLIGRNCDDGNHQLTLAMTVGCVSVPVAETAIWMTHVRLVRNQNTIIPASCDDGNPCTEDVVTREVPF